MRSILRLLLLAVLLGLGLCQTVLAQNRCDNTPDYFQPVNSGDGQRYPLTIGPLVWHLIGSGVYPVKGSDGLTHLAFAMQFTNVWGIAATIQSVDVIDPSHGDKVTGANRVVSAKDEDVTGQVKLASLPSTMDKTNYSTKIGGGESGVMFFDVTYGEGDVVPCAISLRVHALQPENKHLPESTVTSPPMKVSSQAAIVLAPPLKGDGWVNGNGCCEEIGPHRFVMNPMNGSLDPSEQFAIDWIKVDAQGKGFRGDGKKSEDWFCYGVDVLAVGPGTVIETMRDLPDVPPGVAPTNLTVDSDCGESRDPRSGRRPVCDVCAFRSPQRDGACWRPRSCGRQTWSAGQQRKHHRSASAFSDQRPAFHARCDVPAIRFRNDDAARADYSESGRNR